MCGVVVCNFWRLSLSRFCHRSGSCCLMHKPRGKDGFGWNRFDEEEAKAGYRRYLEEVRREAPADRLIEWAPGDGWEPICEFLDTATEFRIRVNQG